MNVLVELVESEGVSFGRKESACDVCDGIVERVFLLLLFLRELVESEGVLLGLMDCAFNVCDGIIERVFCLFLQRRLLHKKTTSQG